MKFCKIFCFVLFSIVFANFSLANALETVGLHDYEIKTLKAPDKNIYEKKYSLNPEIEETDPDYLYSEEDVFENKAGKVFSKFINDKVINNKINQFTTKIAE